MLSTFAFLFVRTYKVFMGASWSFFDLIAASLCLYGVASMLLSAVRGLKAWKNSAKELPRLRRLLVWNWLRSYFSLGVEGADTLPRGPAVYALQPHGLVPLCAVLAFACHGDPPLFEAAPTILLAATKFFFPVPLVRNLAALFGCVDASRETIKEALARGRSVAILVGGVREMAMCHDGSLLYDGHWEFIRLAHEAGVPVVPVYCSGEADAWFVYKPFPRLFRFFSRRGLFFPALFLGPLPVRLTVRFGKWFGADRESPVSFYTSEMKRLSGGEINFVNSSQWEEESLRCSF